MIVREDKDGSLILINQGDHAHLSGVMGAHWGNANFARPTPWLALTRAATWHDCGWRRYETSPIFDFDKRAPPHFPNVPLDDAQLDAYQAGIDWLRAIDPYAGALISAHRTGLWKQRYGAIASPPLRAGRPLTDDVQAFIGREEARQAALVATIDARQYHVNYQLLQILDLLSLYLCVKEPVVERIEFAPNDYAGDGKSGVSLQLTPEAGARIAIDPYPFDVRPMEVSIVYRRLTRRDFKTVDEFRKTLFGASPRTLSYTFV